MPFTLTSPEIPMPNPRPDEHCPQKEQKANSSNEPEPSTYRGQSPLPRTLRIRALNDRLRRLGLGGMVMGSRGFVALDTATQVEVLAAVRSFDAFTEANDPWGEHDCAVIEVAGERVIWKIDAYDRSLTLASPDPADPKVTRRVLTIMLAEEY